eukprot:TRINITY_DN6482_c0_g1_i1.p1 TRINITY_DN6482_c0_g1~~TRINITY_DN6482_c0_g1_i1.p1  ORF type:complete len:168 (+),score=12.70 TRINITY_DN6482_c0_g1_i1:134-637(+)
MLNRSEEALLQQRRQRGTLYEARWEDWLSRRKANETRESRFEHWSTRSAEFGRLAQSSQARRMARDEPRNQREVLRELREADRVVQERNHAVQRTELLELLERQKVAATVQSHIDEENVQAGADLLMNSGDLCVWRQQYGYCLPERKPAINARTLYKSPQHWWEKES